MEIFDIINDYEQLVFINDKDIGLKAIVCIHNTSLGPALGGCRLFNYKSESDAINDVVRLAKSMTYKSAACGLNLGGGKSVIIADPQKINREVIFRSLGKFIEGLGGRYITAEDVNTTVQDMSFVQQSTKYVAGLEGHSGDPSYYTALGVFSSIKAVVKQKYQLDNMKKLKVLVQGVGHVGSQLCEMLKSEGADLLISDLNQNNLNMVAEKFNAEIVHPENLLNTQCDIFSPNAMGGIINDEFVDKIKATAVAGAANNQLLEEKHAVMLKQKGVLYAPDFIANAGGLLNVVRDIDSVSIERVIDKTKAIYDKMLQIFATSINEDIDTNSAANRIAEDRIKNLSKLDRVYTERPKVVYEKINH